MLGSIFSYVIVPLCASILGHSKAINFPFETNGKLMVLGVPILNHIKLDDLLTLFINCMIFALLLAAFTF